MLQLCKPLPTWYERCNMPPWHPKRHDNKGRQHCGFRLHSLTATLTKVMLEHGSTDMLDHGWNPTPSKHIKQASSTRKNRHTQGRLGSQVQTLAAQQAQPKWTPQFLPHSAGWQMAARHIGHVPASTKGFVSALWLLSVKLPRARHTSHILRQPALQLLDPLLVQG